MTKILIAVALVAAGCTALPREEVPPAERGEIKTGTNINHRDRDSKTQTYQVDPASMSTRPPRGGG